MAVLFNLSIYPLNTQQYAFDGRLDFHYVNLHIFYSRILQSLLIFDNYNSSSVHQRRRLRHGVRIFTDFA